MSVFSGNSTILADSARCFFQACGAALIVVGSIVLAGGEVADISVSDEDALMTSVFSYSDIYLTFIYLFNFDSVSIITFIFLFCDFGFSKAAMSVQKNVYYARAQGQIKVRGGPYYKSIYKIYGTSIFSKYEDPSVAGPYATAYLAYSLIRPCSCCMLFTCYIYYLISSVLHSA